MSVNGLAGIPEVCNAFLTKGRKAPPNMFVLTDTGGGGVLSSRSDDYCVTGYVANDGSGCFTACKAPGGYGDGKKPPEGERGTNNFMAGTAQNRETITRLCNGEGTGMSIKTGSGKPTILISTGDGQSGVLITRGFVALFSEGTELIVHGAAAKITSTYHLIQETNKGGGKVFIKTNSGSQTLVSTDA
jgi:hypothetical protein